MEKKLWGTTRENEEVYTYEIAGAGGIRATFMNYGANLLSLTVPDKDGNARTLSWDMRSWRTISTTISTSAAASLRTETGSATPDLP